MEKKTTTRGRKKSSEIAPKLTQSEQLIKEIRRNTKRIFTAEQKVIIIMEGISGELSVSELCRKYTISTQTYYTWNKEFIEADKCQLSGDGVRQATSTEVADLKQENSKLKESLADLVVRYDIVKKACKCWNKRQIYQVYETFSIRKSRNHPHRQAIRFRCQPDT